MSSKEELGEQDIIRYDLGSATNEEIIQKFWPHLEVTEKLGAGSFGAVYRVENKQSQLRLASAVKLIRFPQDENETQSSADALGLDTVEKLRSYYRPTLAKVMDEIRLMEELKTSGSVVTIQDFACLESQDPFCWVILIRMELLTSLADYRKSHTLSVDEVVQVGKDMCRALEICHKRNIIHRDVKESNIFRSEHGTYKLGDFGISRHMEGNAQELSHKGTGSYMAPEILRGEDYDYRVDIYALGISLYRLLNNNRLPFLPAAGPLTMDTVEAANARRLSGQVLPDPQRGDQELANILRKACAYKVEDRYASAADFGEALDFYLLRKKEKATAEKSAPVVPEDEEKTFAAATWQSQQMAALGIKAEQSLTPEASSLPESSAVPYVNPYASTPASVPATGGNSAGAQAYVNPYASQGGQAAGPSSGGQAPGTTGPIPWNASAAPSSAPFYNSSSGQAASSQANAAKAAAMPASFGAGTGGNSAGAQAYVNPYASQGGQAAGPSSGGQAPGTSGPVPWNASAAPGPAPFYNSSSGQAASSQPAASASFNREAGSSSAVGSDLVQTQKAKSKSKLLLILLISLALIAVIFIAIYLNADEDGDYSLSTRRSSYDLDDDEADWQEEAEGDSDQDWRDGEDEEEEFEEEPVDVERSNKKALNRGDTKDDDELRDTYRTVPDLDAALRALALETGTDWKVSYEEDGYKYWLAGYVQGDVFEGSLLRKDLADEQHCQFGNGTYTINYDVEESTYNLRFKEGTYCATEAGQNGLLLSAGSGTFYLYVNRDALDNLDYSQMDYTVYECANGDPAGTWYHYHYVGERYAEPEVEVDGAPDFWQDPREMDLP